jgi:hypothetical protein
MINSIYKTIFLSAQLLLLIVFLLGCGPIVEEDEEEDQAPIVINPISDIYINDVDFSGNEVIIEIELNDVFDDSDNDNEQISFIATSNNSTLIDTSVEQTQLHLAIQPSQQGSAEVTIIATSNGLSVNESFLISISDQPPQIVNPLVDIILDEQDSAIQIDLSQVFNDLDDDNELMIYSVVASNESLISATINQSTLNLVTQDGESGVSEITISANSDGQLVEDNFQVTVLKDTSGTAKVFLLAGQSNMVGHGSVSELEEIEQSLNEVRNDVFIASVISPNKSINNLQPGYGNNNNKFGVELKFGHVIGDNFDAPVYLFKAAKGGTTIEELDDWRPQQHGGDANNLYAQMITEFNLFIETELEDNDIDYEISGFIWFQGYNDVAQGFEANYQTNLSNLLSSVRADLDLPELPIVITQINDIQGAKGKVVMDAQATLANESALNTLVITGDQRPYYHYGSRSYVIIGDRIAQATLSVLNKPVAHHDNYAVAPNQDLVVNSVDGVLNNDSDTAAQIQLVSNVSYGELNLNANGSFSYLSEPGFVGEDYFEYRMISSAKLSNTAKVTIQVHDIESSLVLHFDFDGEQPLQDKVSGIKSIIKRQGVSYVNGKTGQAAHFDGSAAIHYLENYPIPEYLSLSSERDFSLSTWVKNESTQEQEQIIMSNKYYYNSRSGWALTSGGEDAAIKAYLGTYDNNEHKNNSVKLTSSESNLNDNSWHHVALTVNFTTNKARLYLDGTMTSEKDISQLSGDINRFESAIGDGSGGGDGNSNGFIGAIDDVKIFNKELSAEEVSVLAN